MRNTHTFAPVRHAHAACKGREDLASRYHRISLPLHLRRITSIIVIVIIIIIVVVVVVVVVGGGGGGGGGGAHCLEVSLGARHDDAVFYAPGGARAKPQPLEARELELALSKEGRGAAADFAADA